MPARSGPSFRVKRHTTLNGQMGEEYPKFIHSHVFEVKLILKKNKLTNLVEVEVFSVNAEVL